MVEDAYLLLALLAAILYAFAAPCLKLATERGMSSLQTTLLANIAAAVGFSLVFLPWGSGRLTPSEWGPSLLVGLLFFGGQVFTVMALKHGHASIATPALGSKVVIVACLVGIHSLELNVILAAVLTTVGIVVLAFPTQHFPWSKIIPAVSFSLLAAATFGLFDVLTKRWSPAIGFGLLIPWALMIAALITAMVILPIERRWPRVPKGAGTHLWLGIGLLTVQSMVFVWAIGTFGDPARLNVVYGSRGVWSVMVVWLFGRWLSQQERFHTKTQLVTRLIGAVLIAIAVALVFWRPAG